MKSKKLTGILIAAVIILLVCVVGTTFAYYFAVLRGQNENTISTSKATLILTEQEDPFETVQVAKEQDVLYDGAPGYKFTLSANSTGRAAIAYAIYLEEVEGNTIDAEDISVSLVLDHDTYENRIPVYDYGIRCATDYTIVGDGYCSEYPEIHDELYSWEKVDTNSNPYGANTILHEYLFKIEDYNLFCNDKKTYYYEETINVDGEEQIDSTIVGSEEEIVDNSYCKYYEDTYPWSKSRSLVGEDSIRNNLNLFDATSYFSESEISTLKQKNLIYMDVFQNARKSPLNESVTYKLRYFINSDNISGDVTEGTVNGDGSVSVELGQDGVFKFKIGVYAKSISPS